jgi:dUTP pyrophosphatase
MEKAILFTPIRMGLKIPERHTYKSAGIDLFVDTEVTLSARDSLAIATGFEVILPNGHFGRIDDCSSVAMEKGLHVLAGIVDEDYQGEIIVLLQNTTDLDVTLKRHEKLAQMIVIPYHTGTPGLLTVSFKRHLKLKSDRKKSVHFLNQVRN